MAKIFSISSHARYQHRFHRTQRAELEKQGFPRKDPINGLRFIPAIEAFWASRIDRLAPQMPQSVPVNEDALENFGGKGQRRAS